MMLERLLDYLFGPSWRTSLMGLLGGVGLYFDQVGAKMPATWEEWKSTGYAALIYAVFRLAKDQSVHAGLGQAQHFTGQHSMASMPNVEAVMPPNAMQAQQVVDALEMQRAVQSDQGPRS